MKKLQSFIVNSLVLTFCGSLTPVVAAQNLSEEVVIDRKIEPVQRGVVRPSWVTPTILTPQVQTTQLTFNEYVRTAQINRSINPLQPVAWGDSVMRSPYRGYAMVGYFPVYNLSAAAGYRFLNTDKLRAGAHASFQGSSWNGGDAALTKNKRNQLNVGADGAIMLRPGTLSAVIGYTYSSTQPAQFAETFNRGDQALNAVDLQLKWTPSSQGKLGWNAGFDLAYGGFGSDKSPEFGQTITVSPVEYTYKPVHDVVYALKGDLSYRLKPDSSQINLGVDLRLRHIDRYMNMETVYTEGQIYGMIGPRYRGAEDAGLITLKPAYVFRTKHFDGQLGVRADFNAGSLKKNVYVAPDVHLYWIPNARVAAYAHATGGEVMNTNTELWERNPWMTGVMAFKPSHVDADIEVGINYGIYKGFRAGVIGGWSAVTNWLTPVNLQGINTWRTRTFNGFTFGVELGYAFKDIVDVAAHARGAQHCKYYRWQDNAKWAFDIAAKVRPIKKLQIEAGFEMRFDRQGYYQTVVLPEDAQTATLQTSETDLGNSSNLFVGAEYQITRALSAIVKAENLLNKHYYITNNVRGQGIHGLIALQMKF